MESLVISDMFDVFLSYDPTEVEKIELIARRLHDDEIGLRPWLDRWHLVPGKLRQEQIELALTQCSTCAVFIGAGGLSGWHQEQMRVAIESRIQDGAFRVIPVLLQGAKQPERGDLPPFLQRHVFVDFRSGLDDAYALHLLVSGIKGVAPGVSTESLTEIECPYRGLLSFSEEHTKFFFGRESLIKYLVMDLQQKNFLLINGASGSGKSSLVHAGLIPKLRAGTIQGSQDWIIQKMKPDSAPLDSLAGRLAQLLEPANPVTTRLSVVDALRSDPKEFIRTVRQIQGTHKEVPYLLVVDQFEEVFTLCQDERERQSFIDALLYATELGQKDVYCILTMRADFYGKATLYPELGARIERNQRNVSPMSVDEMRQAIEMPAKLVGLHFEKGLVDTILADTKVTSSTLPLLEYTLSELYRKRRERWLTFDAYQEIGGVEGAVSKRIDQIYEDFTADQQRAMQYLMLRLTQPGLGTEDTRRRATKNELLSISHLRAEMTYVIQKCTDDRLLTTSYDEVAKVDVVDIAHEALIQGWSRLRSWLDDNRANLFVHRRLTDAATEWSLNGEELTFLYRGARLREAINLVDTNSRQLNELEQRFLQASQKARTTSMLSRGGLAILAIFVVSVAVLAIMGVLDPLIYRPIQPDMVTIQAGSFTMGIAESEIEEVNQLSDEIYALTSEMPEHEVYLDTYEIMRNETTNREYRQCVLANTCSAPSDELEQWNDTAYNGYPVVGVTWDDANTYCHWIGGSLPTEAQWEKAAKGTTGWRYPWGTDPDSTKAYVDVVNGAPKPVESYPDGFSPYGIADMAGNVWEWTADYFDEGYYRTLPPQANNPTGPVTGESRTVRGGSYDNNWVQARTTYRDGALFRPGDTGFDLGFRCVR